MPGWCTAAHADQAIELSKNHCRAVFERKRKTQYAMPALPAVEGAHRPFARLVIYRAADVPVIRLRVVSTANRKPLRKRSEGLFRASRVVGAERFRTLDLLNPIQVRYQAAPRPEADESSIPPAFGRAVSRG